MSTTKKGYDVLVSVGGTVIGGQRNASVELEKETIDKTTKDSNGWAENDSGVKSWSCECDGLVYVNNAGYEACYEAFANDTVVDIQMATEGLDIGKKGKALVTTLSLEAPYDDDMTYAVSFTGTGALSKVTPPARVNTDK